MYRKVVCTFHTLSNGLGHFLPFFGSSYGPWLESIRKMDIALSAFQSWRTFRQGDTRYPPYQKLTGHSGYTAFKAKINCL